MSDTTREVVRHFLHLHPAEAAREMESASPDDVARVLAGESPQTSATVLRYMQPDHAAEVLAAAGTDGVHHLISAIDPARAANLLARLPEEARATLLTAVPAGLGTEIHEILAFPPGTAGKLMDARVALFSNQTSVGEALERIQGLRNRRISDLVITNDEGKFDGVVRLQDVVGAEPSSRSWSSRARAWRSSIR